jgi:uncharacterized membrane protein (DUF485 family)
MVVLIRSLQNCCVHDCIKDTNIQTHISLCMYVFYLVLCLVLKYIVKMLASYLHTEHMTQFLQSNLNCCLVNKSIVRNVK